MVISFSAYFQWFRAIGRSKVVKVGYNGSDKFSLTWHWPAFFVPFLWMLYRKLYLWALLVFILDFTMGLIPYVGFLVPMIVFGMTGNYIYYKHTKKKLLEVKLTQPSSDVLKAEIARSGGVNNLVVFLPLLLMPVIGILAAIAIPNFLRYQAKAKQSEAKVTLGGIYTAQITYMAENNTYAQKLTQLEWAPPGNARYTYIISNANSTSFVAIANGNIDNDPTVDEWRIDETKTLTNITNDITN